MTSLRSDMPLSVRWDVKNGDQIVYITGQDLALSLMAPPGAEQLIAERGPSRYRNARHLRTTPAWKVVVLEAPRSLSRAANLN